MSGKKKKMTFKKNTFIVEKKVFHDADVNCSTVMMMDSTFEAVVGNLSMFIKSSEGSLRAILILWRNMMQRSNKCVLLYIMSICRLL